MCDDHGRHAPAPPIETEIAREAWRGEVLPLEPVDGVSIVTVCDNTVDMLLLDEGPARRVPIGGEPARVLPAPTLVEGKSADAPLAQHGFSALVTVSKGEREHRILFDTGVTPDGCVENMARLDLDPGDIEVVVCSHGHFDHTVGLSGLADRLGRTGMPVLIHPEFWTQRRVNIPGRDPFELPTTSRRGLEEAHFEVVENRQPSFLFERSVLITGEVDRTTSFETGFVLHEARRNDHWEPDPLILDDQALIVNVRDQGLVVLTGCGHAGVVNIVRYAQRLTGIDPIHMLMGGFHLNGPLFEPMIDPTCEALDDIAPATVVPAHCTGWRAQHALAARLPDAFIQGSVGTTYVL
jgi:7,8-dihydropterin-6-yl-methyl-4-(beta-D-ribofuranosyl)aminobenzene 5'-phosphate synthase